VRIEAGQQGSDRGPGPRRLRHSVLEEHAFRGKGIDPGGRFPPIPIAAEVIGAQRVDQIDDDVRPPFRRGTAGEARRDHGRASDDPQGAMRQLQQAVEITPVSGGTKAILASLGSAACGLSRGSAELKRAGQACGRGPLSPAGTGSLGLQ
jgi:hypothetical protein